MWKPMKTALVKATGKNRPWRKKSLGCKCDLLASAFMLCLLFLLLSLKSLATDSHIEESQRLMASGNLEAAEHEARLAMSDPATKALGLAMLGAIRLQQMKTQEGIAFLKEAIQTDPRLVGARLNLGEACFRAGKTVEAREAYQQALRLKPDSTVARLDLAQLEASAGNYAASLRVAEPIAPLLRGSPEGILVLATDYFGLKRKGLADPLVAQWKNFKEVPEPLSLEFAQLLAKESLTAAALSVLEPYEKAGTPLSFELAYALAGLHVQDGNFESASGYYETALKLNATCVLCLQSLAKIAEKQNETEKALAYLIKARRLSPEDAGVLFDFGKICLERDLLDDGLEALEKAVRLRPDNDHYVYVLASGYVSKAHYPKAQTLLEGLVKKRPNDSVLHYALGTVLYLEGEFDAAEASLKKSIELNADQTGSYYYLGLTAEKKKNYLLAERIFTNLLKQHPEHTPSYSALGTVLVEMKKYAEAQPVLEKAIRLDPSSTQAHYQLAVALGRIGKREEAAKEAALALECEKKERVEGRKLQTHILMP
jgi:tetratricopeptide (TPR) repeat protein